MVKQPTYNPRVAEIKDELDHLDEVEADLTKQPVPDLTESEVKKPESPKFTKIAASEDKHDSLYPFHDMKPGEGFFVANDDVKGNALHKMREHVFHANHHYSSPTHDVDGNEVWENLTIHGHKHNAKAKYDQFGNIVDEFELDGSGNPVKSVEEISKPKLVHSRHFTVKSVVKDSVISGTTKAPADGVVVMREV